jgi:hypothetical protein
MPVGDIVGFAVIAGSRIILPAEIATIDATAQIPAIATIGTIQFANISIGTVEVGTVSLVLEAGTIGTILSGAVTATVPAIGTIGTIQAGNITASVSGGVLQSIATIGTLQSGNVTASVSGGQLTYVGTIGTIQSGNITGSIANGQLSSVGTVGVIATIGTIQSGHVSSDQISKLTNVATNAVITSATIATIVASNLQDLVVDIVYGTVVTGSIITAVIGVEPQTGIKTSTIVAGAWFAGTVVTGQRLVAPGPLGYEVAVTAYVATAGTINAGTATGVYVTAEQSATS